MSEPISLSEAKERLRAEDGDEVVIAAMIAAARSHCEEYLGVKIGADGVTIAGQVQPLPESVRAAMFLMLGFLYECRDSDAKEIPGAVAHLLDLSPLRQRLGAA